MRLINNAVSKNGSLTLQYVRYNLNHEGEASEIQLWKLKSCDDVSSDSITQGESSLERGGNSAALCLLSKNRNTASIQALSIFVSYYHRSVYNDD